MCAQLASAIYSGKVRHRRFSPKHHAFEYDVFMMYIDTKEIETIFSMSPFWSLKNFSPVQFKRADFHINCTHNDAKHLPDIDKSVRDTVEQKTGMRPAGPIRMLVNLRYWGVNMNPLSTYYCFDNAENLVAILAEVHNTPWNERHAYVLTGEDFSRKQQVEFSKDFHVSPFNPLAMDYHWHSTKPDKTLAIHLENWQNDDKVMDATMTLAREALTAKSMNFILIRFPWMTVKIVSAIYWQAVKLWWKGVPIFDHPKQSENTSAIKITSQISQIRKEPEL
jgi:DUF1365 family protein